MPAPVSVSVARERARVRVSRSLADWIARGGADAALMLPLHPPTERAVLRDGQDVTRRWKESWEGIPGVVLATRSWASVGTQTVPERLELHGADAIATFAGRASLEAWSRARSAAEAIRAELDTDSNAAAADAVSAALASHARRLSDLEKPTATTIGSAARWLVDNPASGLRIRQVPIPGVDTKWLAQHRALVSALYGALTGRPGLDLVAAPELVRMRILDEKLWPAGPRHLSAPAAEWNRVDLRPHTVLVVENLETLLALPDLPGTVAVHGHGYGTSARLVDIEWLGTAPQLLYWGDLDSDGFGILNQLRAALPRFESVLMDEQTLRDHEALWTVDPTKPASLELTHLAPRDLAVRAFLAQQHDAGEPRLEQERILWPYAMQRLHDVIGPSDGAGHAR
ncbi:Wadjet anti-phage system protein JetD domain-containing protein [Microbacterium gorillae]|uniref:Wadjet anti-phage system protein JetD domain-containing protein n=1 Tax=Microbacterium gorillae TaxID=1231063 RepID=UPI003D99B3EA